MTQPGTLCADPKGRAVAGRDVANVALESFTLKKSTPGFSLDRNPIDAISPPSATARSDRLIVQRSR